MHWGITPVTVGNYATLGYDTFTGLQASAVFGVYFKAKDPELKSVTLSAGVTALFGITEPAIYGWPCASNARSSAAASPVPSVALSRGLQCGLLELLHPRHRRAAGVLQRGHMAQFLGFLLSIGVAFTLGVIFSWMAGFQTDAEISQPQPLTSKAV